MGRDIATDAAMDDETTEKLKGFLKSRLSAEDHEQVCNMLAGDVEAEDTEPPPNDLTPSPNGSLRVTRRALISTGVFRMPRAHDIDNSGIHPRRRAASYSAAGAS